MQEFVEYIKIHIISLEQDREDMHGHDSYLNGQITASRHLLSVAEGILSK